MRRALISAIVAYAEERLQTKARKFLQGLSQDELQYIAEFLGACALESVGDRTSNREELAEGIAQFERVRDAQAGRPSDREHKMILLLEYLCRANLTHCCFAARRVDGGSYSAASFNSRIQMLR